MRLREAIAKRKIQRFLTEPYSAEWTQFRFRLALVRVFLGEGYGMDKRHRGSVGRAALGRCADSNKHSEYRVQRTERMEVRNRRVAGERATEQGRIWSGTTATSRE